MKRKLLAISVLCALATGAAYQARAEHVPVTQLPEKVQKAIKDKAKGEQLDHVDRDHKDGQLVYEVEFKNEGLNRRITLDTNGMVMPDRSVAARAKNALGRAEVKVADLPPAVQDTIKKQQAGREVAKVHRDMRGSRNGFDIEFKEKGRNSHIFVANDGSVVEEKKR